MPKPTATLTNIDRFNLTAVVLFAQLYDAFPNPVDIETRALGVSAAPDDGDYTEFFKFAVYAENAVSWLIEEGFVRHEAPAIGSTFRRVRLTLKGLTVLGYMPTSIKPNEKPKTLITRAKQVLANGAEKAAADGVKTVVTEAFKLALNIATSQSAVGLVQA